ncbi:phosphoglycolate phosphatase [Curvibacter sp. HBC61]|uniref:Phosphoglycolate phosphatase n=1 Tax=Curvibacter cyanobacteriorum TaxID=3026422 RepID=A0ABT5N3F1_9BURK|nr:phosphoglycolate phosphatase [Curvibacter sp. HBC61]MDD0840602.1 phosphoglycolate phosphatase [Curvibacter sp. HBC61]
MQPSALASTPLPLDAVILDLDGTMVDTLGDFAQALNRMLADLTLAPVAPELIVNMVGKGSEHLLRSVLGQVLSSTQGLQGDALTERVSALFPAAWDRYQAHYLDINGQFAQVYPGVVAGLEALRQRGLALACLTNKPLAFARPLLEAKGLSGYFSHVFGGDSFERKKPDPQPLLGACAALGTAPARTVMVGDSSNDAQAARAAGCPVWLVTYGYNHGQPIRAVAADAFLDSLAELA